MRMFFGLLLIALTVSPALAVGSEPLNEAGNPLSPKEEEALRLADAWSERPLKPIQTADGKVVYVHGATRPTIIGAPMQISDIELEAGELINEILVGDATRWLVESGTSGAGTSHIFVKPLEAGLETSLVVTTNKRVYHLKLVSKEQEFIPRVGFLYQEQAKMLGAKDRRERHWNTTDLNGQAVDLSSLDFQYQVSGRAPWKPVQVYNDGRQMFIRLPESVVEAPVLLAMKGRQEQLVNYRVHNNTFVVDGLFDRLCLVSGVGRGQARVDIVRKVK